MSERKEQNMTNKNRADTKLLVFQPRRGDAGTAANWCLVHHPYVSGTLSPPGLVCI